MRRWLAFFGVAVLVCSCTPQHRTGSPAPGRAAEPFLDGTVRSGILFRQSSGASKVLNIYQVSAGGCGVLDFDGDGWLDIYLVQGKHRPGPGGGNQLYRNRGDGTFEDVTEKAGVRGHGYGMACAVGDYDADGHPDLYVCNYGRNELFRNRGDGTFEAVQGSTNTAVSGMSVGAVFADLDGDRWPDLYVVRYVELTPRSRLICDQHGIPVSCGPQLYAAQPGVYLHNRQGRGFEERTRAAGLENPGRGMAVVAADLSEDRRLDLFVTNDTTANALFTPTSPGRFRENALLAGLAYGDMGVAEANMGCDVGDYDGDGHPDLVIGVMQDRITLLFRNDGQGNFSLTSRETGLAETTSSVVTYGCGFLDFDNDGDLDLFQANGHVHNLAEQVEARLRYAQPRQLLENSGGRFSDLAAIGGPALNAPAVGRGAAFGDLDNDGDVDVVVNNLDGPPSLLYNQSQLTGRHWLRVRLEGDPPDTSPEGAVVNLRVGAKELVRIAHRAYSYASANDPRLHFGLGAVTQVGPLVVRWPDGRDQEVAVEGVDREIVIKHPPVGNR